MAQLDSFLTRLQQQNASRITMQGDTPMQIELPAGVSEGTVLDNTRIGDILNEIMSPEARAQLEELGAASFAYASPLGLCDVAASRPGGVWRVEIVPPAAPTPQMVTAPLQNVAIQANDSGQRNAVLPPELRGFNWGGLLLSWVWALGHNTWIGLLGLIPVVGFLMRLFLGFKGNEMAWRSRRWESVEQFRATQRTWTVAGLCITLIGGLFFIPMTAAILFPIFARARENARRSACQSNMKQIALSAFNYAEEHNGKFPSGTTMAAWQTALTPYTDRSAIFKCLSAKDGEASYVLNPKMAGANMETITDPASTPMFYDAEARHLDGLSVAFADGHIKWYRSDVWKSGNLPQTSKFRG